MNKLDDGKTHGVHAGVYLGDTAPLGGAVHTVTPGRVVAPAPSMMADGVYFLGNDKVYDLALAFLESFRCSNPTTPLTLIPYDGNVRRLSDLACVYKYDIYDDAAIIDRCDRVSMGFFEGGSGHFRKLATWAGKYERFIYVDIDTVVVRDVRFAFKFLEEYDFVASHSDSPSFFKWVWKPSAACSGRLSREQLMFACNTGFFASRRGAWFPVLTAEQMVAAAVQFRNHMQLGCAEQGFINFSVVLSGMRFTSLHRLIKTTGDPAICVEAWAGTRGGKYSGGQIAFPGLPPVLLLHWAGEWQRGWFDSAADATLGLFGRRGQRSVRWGMPYRQFWEFYRDRALQRISERTMTRRDGALAV